MTATAHVNQAAREAAPWLERLARLGYFAIGVVYAIVGGLTAASSAHRGGGADRNDAIAFLRQQPFGKPLLIVVAVGLAGYALWKIISGITDSDRRGSDAKGLTIRAGAIAGGIVYAGFMIEAIRAAMRHATGAGSDASAKHWSARALDHPFGRWILAAAGLAVLGAGIYQITRAWRAKLSRRLDLSRMSLRMRDYTVAICRFGIGARAIVFVIIGASLVTAAFDYNPNDARGTAGALSAIGDKPFGHFVLAIVAVGLIAYGLFAIVNGRYRHISAS